MTLAQKGAAGILLDITKDVKLVPFIKRCYKRMVWDNPGSGRAKKY
jgi:hypothetical protein